MSNDAQMRVTRFLPNLNLLWLHLIFAAGFCLWCAVPTAYAQDEDSRCPSVTTYVNKNQVDLDHPIVLKRMSGRVFYLPWKKRKELTGTLVCLGLFDEKSRRLVARAVADENGWFRFRKNLPNGKYRLVVKDVNQILCPANIRVQVSGRATRKKRIAVYLVGRAIDYCSWGEVLGSRVR
jgi:hypothetical protein